MNILVCLKQILDPEIPPRDFRVDAEKLEAQRGAAGLVMNIFCANALETALQFRERVGGKITALSFGDDTAEEVLRKALALRVDSAVLVTQELEHYPHLGDVRAVGADNSDRRLRAVSARADMAARPAGTVFRPTVGQVENGFSTRLVATGDPPRALRRLLSHFDILGNYRPHTRDDRGLH